MKKIFTILLSIFGYLAIYSQAIYSENFGTTAPTATPYPTVSNFTGYQNSTPITYAGTAEIRQSTASNYAGASGFDNVFFQTTVSNPTLTISGINTSNVSSSNLEMSLGHYKGNTASSNELKIEVADLTVTTPVWSQLTYTRATGTGTSSWVVIVPSGTIPSTTNLGVRFTNTITSTNFRIDDVKIYDKFAPTISTSSTLLFNNVIVNQTSVTKPLNIACSNLSSNPTYTVTGTDASMFNVTGSLTTTGGTLSVNFTPSSTGAKSATLNITSGSASVNVALTGNGLDSVNPYSLTEGTPVTSISENFESYAANATTITGWTNYASDANKSWSVRTLTNPATNVAQMTAFGGNGYYNTLLISPYINFDAVNKTAAKFDWNSSFDNGSTLKVYVLKLNTATARQSGRIAVSDMTSTLIKTISNTGNTGTNTVFVTETLDLSAISGNGYLAFEYEGNTVDPKTTTFNIDNISIQSILGINEINKSKYLLINNTIVDDNLSLQVKKNLSIRLFNIEGKLVKSLFVSQSSSNIDVSSLNKGVYILTSEIDGEIYSQKIIKK